MVVSIIHIAMYPWFALGHLTPFLHLSNKLAKKGHKIYFLCPSRTRSKLEPFNLHPHLITFVPITVPHVDGLPPGAETTSDVPFPLLSLLVTAMDLTENHVEHLLRGLRVDLVFFDFTHWMPAMARKLGIKSVCYSTVSPATIGYSTTPAAKQLLGRAVTETDMMQPPPGYPDLSIKFHANEARAFAATMNMKFGIGLRFCDRIFISVSQCDALAFRTCQEIEGLFCDYLGSQFQKPVLLSGAVIPDPPASPLEEKWAKWLGGFRDGSVIYCALGSECILGKDQFEELLLALELTGMPFLAALKPPIGANSVEVGLPENFEERVQGRGVVHGEWIQQQLILEHPSIGCFITHCGSGSLWEALVNKCQLVLLPNVGDQIINARMMSRNLKVGVEVEKGGDDGSMKMESIAKAVRLVMAEDSEIGKEVRDNHARLREFLLNKDLESSNIDEFVKKLQDLLDRMT